MGPNLFKVLITAFKIGTNKAVDYSKVVQEVIKDDDKSSCRIGFIV